MDKYALSVVAFGGLLLAGAPAKAGNTRGVVRQNLHKLARVFPVWNNEHQPRPWSSNPSAEAAKSLSHRAGRPLFALVDGIPMVAKRAESEHQIMARYRRAKRRFAQRSPTFQEALRYALGVAAHGRKIPKDLLNRAAIDAPVLIPAQVGDMPQQSQTAIAVLAMELKRSTMVLHMSSLHLAEFTLGTPTTAKEQADPKRHEHDVTHQNKLIYRALKDSL